ncbi:low molecular weight phosphatase family protein [Amnibacterium flavum]|uniref:arsenate reductase/protein-tyrosine-phosphatase family protein n=1 Tax=Amnibacterium flavum TaxID=2173173 RepID=UPI00140201C2|nr:low molecular weight phosphatase family protein [Amnibacterium flavum]
MSGLTGDVPGRVLIVCTGNICRSPYIERALRQRFASLGSDVVVESAGTGALVGHPIAEPMARLMESAGIDAADGAGRRLTRDMVTDADLILTAEREHRSAVVSLLPGALRRTFSVRQFARLLGQLEPGAEQLTLPDLVAVAAASRGATPSQGADDDVPDPWQRPDAEYQRVIDLLEAPLEVIATRVGATRARPTDDA